MLNDLSISDLRSNSVTRIFFAFFSFEILFCVKKISQTFTSKPQFILPSSKMKKKKKLLSFLLLFLLDSIQAFEAGDQQNTYLENHVTCLDKSFRYRKRPTRTVNVRSKVLNHYILCINVLMY